MTRRALANVVVVAALAAIAIASLAFPITRGPGFHRYADQRVWLGVPHAGDVLSNLAFVAIAAWSARRLAARGTRVPARFAWLACAGVFAIGIGSGLYHVVPSDPTLACDWAPIATTLALLCAAVIRDRVGARQGQVALVAAPTLAVASVLWWLATGGTDDGGNMTPYVALQVTGIALPVVLAVIAPGDVPIRWLLVAVALFMLARLLGRYDRELLDAIAVSGHSLKHVAAALAAGAGLAALTSPTWRGSLSSS